MVCVMEGKFVRDCQSFRAEKSIIYTSVLVSLFMYLYLSTYLSTYQSMCRGVHACVRACHLHLPLVLCRTNMFDCSPPHKQRVTSWVHCFLFLIFYIRAFMGVLSRTRAVVAQARRI